MSKSSRPQVSARANRSKVDELRQAQRAKERRSRFILIGSVSAVVLLIAGIVGFTVYNDVSNRPTLDAVKTYQVTRNHTTDPVTYAQTPPVGGDHYPTWLNCGVYTEPVKNELAVHALEHGAVWVTYRPDLPADQVEKLKESIPDTYMVMSPYDGLPGPVVASAWGTQLVLTGADDPRLEEFIQKYRQGAQTPEPGAACTGGSDGDLPPGDRMTDPVDSDDQDDVDVSDHRDDLAREAGPHQPGRGRLALAVLAALVVGVLGTLWVVQARSSPPSDFGADAGFARDMQTHHAQAVEMAFLVRDRTDDEEVRTVAYDIITSQQQQAGQMYGWLVQWSLNQTGSRPPMAWVGGEHAAAHANPDGTMPGMATPAQLAELKAATGVEAERIFLRLMIAHHTGGVAMAQAAQDDARTPAVRTLAGAIAAAQTSEIQLLQQMLDARS